jgi:3-phosphoshikimate 1-carboxyvinyltransferase
MRVALPPNHGRRARLDVSGELRVPGDKSVSHRALIFASLARGESRLRGLLDSADVRSTADVLRRLGVAIPSVEASLGEEGIVLSGVGRRGLRRPSVDLDCGNSGTTARLMAGVVAASPFAGRFVGDESLSRRPMQRVARPLEAMGARVSFEHSEGLPMIVFGGALEGIEWFNETSSAQVKSAVLLAGFVAGVSVTVREPRASRDHTERLLSQLGATVVVNRGSVTLTPCAELRPFDMEVPGDPSSAAYFAALASLADGGRLRLPGVLATPTRDGFLRALVAAGADINVENEEPVDSGEPTVTYVISPAALRGMTVEADDVPAMIDELPLLACVGARAQGETVVTGAGELRVKESDRIAATVSNLRAIGAQAEELPDGFRVIGGADPLRGTVTTRGDHRLAMAFAILGALPGNDIRIDDPAAVGVSYPGFWSDLERVTSI